MSTPMTHLKAFCSDDAKRGRRWCNDVVEFRRIGDIAEYRWMHPSPGEWVVTSSNPDDWATGLRWADEPKTLTPQEALRALADGKCIRPCGGIADLIYRLFDDELMAWDTCMMPYKWRYTRRCSLKECVVVPDPSKTPSERIYQAMDAAEKRPAPSEEFTLTFAEAVAAAARGAVIANSACPSCRYGIPNRGWDLLSSEIDAKWRVVEWKDGKK